MYQGCLFVHVDSDTTIHDLISITTQNPTLSPNPAGKATAAIGAEREQIVVIEDSIHESIDMVLITLSLKMKQVVRSRLPSSVHSLFSDLYRISVYWGCPTVSVAEVAAAVTAVLTVLARCAETKMEE